MTARQLFVYYKLPVADTTSAARAARTAQCALCEQVNGLQVELLQRPRVPGRNAVTLMETYRRPGVGIDPTLQATIESTLAAALAPWLAAGTRHVEVFEPLAADDTRCAS